MQGRNREADTEERLADTGGEEREGIHIHIKLIHAVVQQKLTQHCKAVIFQFKIKSKFERERSQGSL